MRVMASLTLITCVYLRAKFTIDKIINVMSRDLECTHQSAIGLLPFLQEKHITDKTKTNKF